MSRDFNIVRILHSAFAEALAKKIDEQHMKNFRNGRSPAPRAAIRRGAGNHFNK